MRQHNHSISFNTASKGIIYEHLSTPFTHRSKTKGIMSLTKAKRGEKRMLARKSCIKQYQTCWPLQVKKDEIFMLCYSLMCFYTLIWAYGQHRAKQLDVLLLFMAVSFSLSWQSFLWVISKKVSGQVSSVLDIISGLRYKSMAGKTFKWNIDTWEAILQVFFLTTSETKWQALEQCATNAFKYGDIYNI